MNNAIQFNTAAGANTAFGLPDVTAAVATLDFAKLLDLGNLEANLKEAAELDAARTTDWMGYSDQGEKAVDEIRTNPWALLEDYARSMQVPASQ